MKKTEKPKKLNPDTNNNNEENKDLIKCLREEANFVKDCFTKFSFQSIAFSALMYGFIFKFQHEIPYIGVFSLMIVVMNLIVAKIGTYKYMTANRNFGYELHINRIRSLEGQSSVWKEDWVNIGWEEAMRAWRVVVPSVHSYLYYTKTAKRDTIRKVHENNIKNKDAWFMPEKKARKYGATYASGGYIRTMLSILHSISMVAVLLLAITFAHLTHISLGAPSSLNICMSLFVLTVLVFAIWLTTDRMYKNTSRRKLLERELFSIHSCGILWQAVVIIHFRALNKSISKNSSYKDYTRYLSEETEKLCRHIFDIHAWVNNPDTPEINGKKCKPLKYKLRKAILNPKPQSLYDRLIEGTGGS